MLILASAPAPTPTKTILGMDQVNDGLDNTNTVVGGQTVAYLPTITAQGAAIGVAATALLVILGIKFKSIGEYLR